jgi:glycosyltransferase involved in cell wall biosynthesis
VKLVMTLLVRDEQDILRENIEFHLAQGVDKVIVTDNASTDSTPDIVREYERRGLARLILEPSDDYAQGKWVTRMARLAAAEEGADWVINNDADEFWWPRQGDLRSAFESVPDEVGVVVCKRVNFVPRAEDERPFWQRMTVREVESFNDFGRPLPPKAAHRAHPEVTVRQGNHKIEDVDLGQKLDDARIEILHFPMRSYAQFENKIAKGGAAYARNKDLPKRTGRTWRLLYEKWQAGELPAYYDANVAGEDGETELVSDERLADFFASHTPAGV